MGRPDWPTWRQRLRVAVLRRLWSTVPVMPDDDDTTDDFSVRALDAMRGLRQCIGAATAWSEGDYDACADMMDELDDATVHDIFLLVTAWPVITAAHDPDRRMLWSVLMSTRETLLVASQMIASYPRDIYDDAVDCIDVGILPWEHDLGGEERSLTVGACWATMHTKAKADAVLTFVENFGMTDPDDWPIQPDAARCHAWAITFGFAAMLTDGGELTEDMSRAWSALGMTEDGVGSVQEVALALAESERLMEEHVAGAEPSTDPP